MTKHVKMPNETHNLSVNSNIILGYKNGVEWFEKVSSYHRDKVRRNIVLNPQH